MRQEIVLRDDDRIAVIAPHPDDECLGAEDTKLKSHREIAGQIDFSPYTKYCFRG